MHLWILDKDEEVHFLHAVGDKCQLSLTPNPQDRAWVFEVKELGTFGKVMGLSQRWNRLCPNCAARFFERLEPTAPARGKDAPPTP
jgi:hypothetical protein